SFPTHRQEGPDGSVAAGELVGRTGPQGAAPGVTGRDRLAGTVLGGGMSRKPHKRRGADRHRLCDVVGVGASAGGLEAFSALLEHLPGDTGMSIVFVSHLDPKHESILTSLLSRK